MVVVIMAGVPGSGKSSHVRENFSRPSTMVVSADDYFMVDGRYQFDPKDLPQAHGKCLRDFIVAVQSGSYETIVVDNTNTTVVEMAPYVAIAQAYAWAVEIRYIIVDPTLAHSRNTHGVHLDTVWKLHQQLNYTLSNIPPFWRAEIRRV